ncbi:hypothetical protein LCGC14_1934270 [marine sediment metagenome]|uniref:Uncharacterized protein n=1 Tax=marine sediment metagenome TaxID=412755 RepID=A0A0F9FM74_9ZZZZ
MGEFEDQMAHNAANDKAEAAFRSMQSAYQIDGFNYAAAERMGTPSFMLKPRLCIDGNKWSALFGDNIQEGVCGFGDSPDEAYVDFDKSWYMKLEDSRPGYLAALKEQQTKERLAK